MQEKYFWASPELPATYVQGDDFGAEVVAWGDVGGDLDD